MSKLVQLVRDAHVGETEIVVTATRTHIGGDHYNEEGGEYRGHVAIVEDRFFELDKEGNCRIRIEWSDVEKVEPWR